MRKHKGRPLAVLLLLSAIAAAPVAAQQGGALNASQTMRDNLKQLQGAGKSAELVLKNGKSYRGKLAAVGDHSVLVSEIVGREFFDALIAIDEIAAIEVRARGQ